jgi:hypothetical protein
VVNTAWEERRMDLYLVVLFAHIVGALFLFALLGIETIGLLRLRSASSVEAALGWMGLVGIMRKGGPLALLLILVPGLWMAADRWHVPAWTMVALVSMFVLAGIGIVLTGAAMRRLVPQVRQAQGGWSPALTQAVRDPMLVRSLGLRLGLGLGIVAVMVAKPDLFASLVAVVVGGIIGLLVSIAA